MRRRDFLRTSMSVGAGFGVLAKSAAGSSGSVAPSSCSVPFPKAAGLTQYVAEFVVQTQFADISPDVIELGKKSLVDGIGLALAGSKLQTADILQTYINSLGFGGGSSTVIGAATKLPPRLAAFVNGVAIHVEDFDDTQLAVAKDRVYGLLTHPTVSVLPAAFALAETNRKNGKDLMLAYHLGVEVETKIAEAISPRHYEDGFHSTGTCGVFGGASACARLKGFDVAHTVRTLAIAASHAAGLRENFGSMMKPFQAGHATESGVVAADFAAIGWTAADQILEAQRGFFHAYGGSYDPGSIVGRLGKPWT